MLLLGCSDGEVKPQGAISVFEVPADTVLVKVDGEAITAGDFRSRLRYEVGSFRLVRANAKKLDEAAAEHFEKSRIGNMLPQLVRLKLVERYLERTCGGAEPEDADNVLARALRVYRKKGNQPMTLAEVAERLELSADEVRRHVLSGTWEATARQAFDPSIGTVSEDEIEAGLRRLDEYTARAVETNAVTRAACSNLFERIRAGADFCDAAKGSGAEENAECEDWGWFNREDLKDSPALVRWAFKAKVGDIGGPFDVYDGLSIVKLIGRQEGAAFESVVSKATEEVHLARINFWMAEEHPEPRTREHCRSSLLQWKGLDASRRLVEKLMSEAKIEYPNGSQLDFRRNSK